MEKIQINGTDYELDVNKAKELGLLREPYYPKCTGNYFRNLSSGCLYLLIHVGTPDNDHHVQLTNISTGAYFGRIVKVQNPWLISEKEWNQITDNGRGIFEQVKLRIVVKE